MAIHKSHVSTSLVSAVASLDKKKKFLVSNYFLDNCITHLCLNHCVAFSSQTHFRRLLFFVARAFLLFVDSRLEAFVDEAGRRLGRIIQRDYKRFFCPIRRQYSESFFFFLGKTLSPGALSVNTTSIC